MSEMNSRPARIQPRVEIDKRENNGRTYVSAKITVTRGDREHYLSIDPRDIRQVVEDLQAIEIAALEAQSEAIKSGRPSSPREYDRDGRPAGRTWDDNRGGRGGGRGDRRDRENRW